jgi:SDR family mycofactocin-dependent oxidoreductase
MTGRVALVTGAARGIGAATVAALCAQGYAVTAVDSCGAEHPPPGVAYPLASPGDLDAVARPYGDQVLAIHADVRDPAALRSAVADTVTRFGRLDAAVAAAGVLVGGQPLWETPAEQLATLFDVNAVGVWNTAAAVVPAMLAGAEPAGCRFVAVASAAGERGLFRLAGYSASKHATIGIVRGLAADLAGTGITAVAVSPGSTRTAMLEATASLYDTAAERLADHQLIRRLLDPSEIAATIALCCSRDGAALNGSVVHADGGFTG